MTIALSILMTNSGLHWDLVPKKDKNLKWYIDGNFPTQKRVMKGFLILVGKPNEEMEAVLLACVSPQTCGSEGQATKEWFLDQMFSGTSSQIHHLVKAAVPLLMSGNDLDNNQRDAVTAFLKFLQQEALVDLPINEADETEEEIQDEDSKSAEQKEAED